MICDISPNQLEMPDSSSGYSVLALQMLEVAEIETESCASAMSSCESFISTCC